jgi:predicted SprT family Zn-dependent metalloprotease
MTTAAPFRTEVAILTEEWDLPAIEITINGRLSRAVARTLIQRGLLKMEISKKLLDFPFDAQLEVARHEFAHALEYKSNGRLSHSPVWKRFADKVGAFPNAAASVQERVDATERYAESRNA